MGSAVLDGLGRAGTPVPAEPPGGGGDDSAVPGTAVWCAIAAGLPELYRPIWVQLGQYGPGVLLPLCPVVDRREAVEVGSSRMAGTTIPVATMSCVSISQARHAIVHKETVTSRPWWHMLVGGWWRIDYTPLGTPRGRYDEHNSKSSLSCETKVYQTSRRKPNFRRWCLLASRQLRTIYKAPCPGLCFAPVAIWNLHTTQPRTLPQLTMRLSISPVCCKQRIKRIEW
jgi:hypothetical protein